MDAIRPLHINKIILNEQLKKKNCNKMFHDEITKQTIPTTVPQKFRELVLELAPEEGSPVVELRAKQEKINKNIGISN